MQRGNFGWAFVATVALAIGASAPTRGDDRKPQIPDLKVETAFLDLSKPSFDTVVDRLVKAGHDEIVVVPLLLTEAYHAKVDVPEAIAAAMARHDGVRIQASRILGMETAFLEVLDALPG